MGFRKRYLLLLAPLAALPLAVSGSQTPAGAKDDGKRPPPIATSCAAYPTALRAAATGDRAASLGALKVEFSGAGELLERLAATPLDSPAYYAVMERVAERLNELTLAAKPVDPGAAGGAIAKLWQAFPAPGDRSEATKRVSTQCLEGPDPPFRKYSAQLTAAIGQIAALLPAREFGFLLERTASVPTLPAGLASPFAATNSFTADGARICVNPEEAPPWLIGRMMHEYVHSRNKDIKQLLQTYEAARAQDDDDKVDALRPVVDVERFLDEHRAYLIDVLASRAIIATAPDYFCRLWVPSYQAQRPILYPQAYVDLEKHFENGTVGVWIAELYTFKMHAYRPKSLFVRGEAAGGLLPEVARRSQALLTELWPAQ